MGHDKRFLLHIGANKTGTSSIQTMLAANPGPLAAAGWVYPDFHRSYDAHHPLAYSIGELKRGLKHDWEGELKALISDPRKRFIFSSEVFFRLVDPERVARVFPPGETMIAIYLRDHLSYMSSWYAQAVQERNLTACFEDYVRLFSQPLNGFLARWDAVFGAENVTLRLFQREALADGDVRRDFVRLIDGVDPEAIRLPEKESNPSISGNLLFFKRLLNNYMTLEEATAPPIPDEFGAFADVKPGFRGRFAITEREASVVRKIFGDDIRALQERGLPLGALPSRVDGLAVPDFTTLGQDVQDIKRIAEGTGKRFLRYAERWQDWHAV